MPIDFPSGPATGQVYSYQGNSWVYNGTAWDTVTPAFGDAFLPAGSIIQWSTNTAPTNWLICDGSAVSRNTFSSLFAAIGTQYGAGNGTTTFNLPDLRGRVAVGLDSTQTEFDTLGESGGAKTHTLTASEMPSHTHTGTTSTDGSHTHGQYGRWSSFSAHNHYQGPTGAAESSNPDQGVSSNMGSTYAAGAHSHTFTTAAAGSGAAHNNLQPYEVLHYIIKASAGTTSGDSELATRLGAAEAAVARNGLALIVNHSFTSSTSVVISNCFSALYDVYQIYLLPTAGGTSPIFQMRTGTTTQTTAYAGSIVLSTGSGVIASNRGSTGFNTFGNSARDVAAITLSYPFNNRTTSYLSLGQQTGSLVGMDAAWLDTTTSYESMVMTFTSATSGNIVIYGMRK